MAELTLSEKAVMANSVRFQRRIVAAVKGTAEYWKNFTFSQLSDYNEANRKKKVFAKNILNNASIPNPQAYAEYLLNIYKSSDPDLDVNGELSDQVIGDSSVSIATFEYFAGVEAGDDAKSVQF